MPDVLNNFQTAALQFNPLLLIVPGGIGVVVGIAVWLAGINFSKIIAPVIGFVGGATAAFMISNHPSPAPVLSAAIFAAIVSLLVHKVIIAITGYAALVAVCLVFFIINSFAANPGSPASANPPAPLKYQVTNAQALDQTKTYVTELTNELAHLSKKIPGTMWFYFAGAVIAVLVVGSFFGRIFFAVASGTLGVIMVFFGMTCLLLYKGSAPLTHIYCGLHYYFAVFAGMVVAGAASQLLLCTPPKMQVLKEEKELKKEPVRKT
jgi:hypothetical protein